ncbi:DUF2760 domain-containing protein [Thermochromatium tepidum]|jgi:hypothetical protein|uniref:DUF2760 domain-containing protein n=1 Tax=Thermochromatium tepidum ATCC 43061 TaxID=316276 RepID=A0A6I6E1V8_THETI|nr:DUF2760 domain-containing protein [Thermochromatium tepidum]QGU32915.1 DUF2760 domain-containing protein [Thermochromatium tepidum ATCC 43061]
MASSAPSFFRRVSIAFDSLRRALKDPEFARTVAALARATPVHRAARPVAPATPPLGEAASDSALLLLGLLQREGRLIDFLQEEIQGYSDAEIGRGARVVHQGCRKVLNDYLSLAPVYDAPEGSRVTLEPGFDAAAIRPTGNLVGEPPFSGTLAHRGWRVTEIRLPQLTPGHDPRILAAAEVEL